eukprot:3109964-Rhodomonas_salina.1
MVISGVPLVNDQALARLWTPSTKSVVFASSSLVWNLHTHTISFSKSCIRRPYPAYCRAVEKAEKHSTLK